MTKDGAHTAILTSALVVGGIYGVRKLVEPAASVAHAPAKSLAHAALQVAGAEPAPAPIGPWAMGFGFVYTSLAVFATFAPGFAGSMAVLVAVSDTIINGGALFADVSTQVGAGPSAASSATSPALTGTVASGVKGHAPVHGAQVRLTNTGQLH